MVFRIPTSVVSLDMARHPCPWEVKVLDPGLTRFAVFALRISSGSSGRCALMMMLSAVLGSFAWETLGGDYQSVYYAPSSFLSQSVEHTPSFHGGDSVKENVLLEVLRPLKTLATGFGSACAHAFFQAMSGQLVFLTRSNVTLHAISGKKLVVSFVAQLLLEASWEARFLEILWTTWSLVFATSVTVGLLRLDGSDNHRDNTKDFWEYRQVSFKFLSSPPCNTITLDRDDNKNSGKMDCAQRNRTVSSPNRPDSQQSRVFPESCTLLFMPNVVVETQESVVMLPEIASSAARLATSSKMARRTLRQVHLVTLTRKPDISGCVFAIMQNQTTNISEELPGISSIRDVEYDIEFASGAKPIAEAPYRISPVKWSCCSADRLLWIGERLRLSLNGKIVV
ncbi:hypothetical protein Tco_0260029 [Tanacetum coccineum]